MSLNVYLLFVLASALLVATPGPNVALVVGTSLRYGTRAGLTTVAGVGSGIVLQLTAVVLGLSWIVDLFARHFDIIRYVGAAYLALLGLQQLLARPPDPAAAVPTLSRERALARGFIVAFANPKTLVFHAAFLPQFLAQAEGSMATLWLLAATYAVISVAGDTLWCLGASRARAAVSGRAQRIADRASGAILLGGAAVLLAAGRR